jgi:hypothetical protein
MSEKCQPVADSVILGGTSHMDGTVVLWPIPPSQRMKMLIDIALVPVGVANRRQVEKLNAVFDRLSARRVDKIMLPELGSGFRASNLIRV